MTNPTGQIGQLRREELPVVRVIVPPDPSGRVFEDGRQWPGVAGSLRSLALGTPPTKPAIVRYHVDADVLGPGQEPLRHRRRQPGRVQALVRQPAGTSAISIPAARRYVRRRVVSGAW